MTKHAAPARKTRPESGWVAISDDDPPLMYEIDFHRANLKRTDLRHIKVAITPMVKKKKKVRKR